MLGFKKTDLWIVATGNDKVDDYNLTGFVESLLKATKKQYNVRVVSPASVPFLDSSRNTSQNIDVKNARVVIVGGNNASSGETEIKLAEICAACGCQVLLLTSDDSSQSANTSERVCVVNVPKIREDIFLFSRMLLEESFKKDNSSTALMTAEV
jgi:fructoselysine-6-P-deglycase FrlB-like protein